MENENKTQGWVYVLTNPDIIGKVKIGHTTRSVEERIKELSAASGVPHPFVLFHTQPFQNSEKTEKLIHAFLSPYRDKKEFFMIAPERAMQVVDNFFYHEKFAQYDQRIQNLEKQNQEKEQKIMGLEKEMMEQKEGNEEKVRALEKQMMEKSQENEEKASNLKEEISEQNEQIEKNKAEVSTHVEAIHVLWTFLFETMRKETWTTLIESVKNEINTIIKSWESLLDEKKEIEELDSEPFLTQEEVELQSLYYYELKHFGSGINNLRERLQNDFQWNIAFYYALDEERYRMYRDRNAGLLFKEDYKVLSAKELVDMFFDYKNEIQTLQENLDDLIAEIEDKEEDVEWEEDD